MEDLPAPSSHLSSISIDSSDTFRSLAGLDPEKAMGCDKISQKVLKSCATSLSDPVATLLNMNLATSCTWKMHHITPIPKSGDLLLCVTIGQFLCFVYERVIDFVRPKSSLAQYGFLSKRS